jgi:hypothetical protein
MTQLTDYIEDAATLSPTALRAKYGSTYSIWRNMKYRRKMGAVIAPEFMTFPDFLRHMGPRPGSEFSLDRIDNENPAYGPGLCSWATSSEQALNKSNVVLLTDENGVTKPLVTWADELGVSRYTLYQRRSQGWSDTEVLRGKGTEVDPLIGLPWPKDKAMQWEAVYQKQLLSNGDLDETRHDFLVRVSGSRLQSLSESLRENIDPYDGPTDKQKIEIQECERWERIYSDAVCSLSQIKAEEAFAGRREGLGRQRERALLAYTKGHR